MTGLDIRCAPCTAASIGGVPARLNSNIFSPVTIASSTTIPTARMKPKLEIELRDTSNKTMTVKADTNETAIPNETHNAKRKFKNRARAAKTNTQAITAFRLRRSNRLSNSCA